jgi:mono/diheme cytochrome c family protein
MARIFLGVVVGILLVPIVVLGWFWFGNVPVAVGDQPLPHERSITHIPLRARIDREMLKKAPILVDEDDLIGGAHVYREQCANCHGYHGKPSAIGPHMYPAAPPLWEKHGNSDTVGVSDDAPGETYWKVANGVRLTGMPAYKGVLNDTEIWQVSLLLANADKPLPPAVLELLHGNPAPGITNAAVSAAVVNTTPGNKSVKKK